MTSPPLAPPPAGTVRRTPAPPPGGAARAPEPRARPAFGRVWAWSVGVSVVLHLLVLLLSPLFIRFELPSLGPGSESAAARAPRGIQLINPVASADAPTEPERMPPEQERPTPAERLRVPTPAAAPARGGGEPARTAPDAAPGEGRSVSEALRPGYRDERLYVEAREAESPRQTEHQRYMEGLEARILARRDSAAAAAAAAAPNTDWTFRDGGGNRWGLSEEGVHLGPIKIPRALIPVPQTGTAEDAQAARERARQREEIRRQEADRERREEQERAKAETRAREDAKRKGSGG